MTAAVIAQSYDDARTAASQMSLGHDWTYPHSVEAAQATAYSQIIFVDGYSQGPLPVEAIRAVYENALPDAVVTYHDAAPTFDSLMAPFIDPDSIDLSADYRPRHAQHDRRGWAARLIGALTGAAVGIGGLILALFNGWLP